MNIAVVDLGTNTFNLLIAQVKNNDFSTTYATKEFVQLGKGGINSRIIREDAFERGLNTLNRFKNKAQSMSCNHILCIATSAVRNAKNGQEFVNAAKTQLDLDIQIIDGNKEAEYIYLGAKQAVKVAQNNVLIMDVGGGSTEFIICNNQEIIWKQSFEVGAARLFEGFHKSNPIANNEVNSIENHLQKLLSPLFDAVQKYGFEKLVGCSGAFSSFASIIMNTEDKEDLMGTPTEYTFDIPDFKKLHEQLMDSTLEERLVLKGLIKQRAPMIVVGSILVNFILNELSVKYFELSNYALKEGVIMDYLNKN